MSGQGGRVCPRCSTPTSGVSRWCSGCGLNLELAGQLPTAEDHEATKRKQGGLADQVTTQAQSPASEPQSPPAQPQAEVPPVSALGTRDEPAPGAQPAGRGLPDRAAEPPDGAAPSAAENDHITETTIPRPPPLPNHGALDS